MATESRAEKYRLDYFSFDVDFFNDEKVQFVSARFGEKGELITIKLLTRIYRNGYYLKWDEDMQLLFAKAVGATHHLVNDIVQELLKRDFFNKGIHERFGILTGSGIQKRWTKAIKTLKRDVKIEPKFAVEIQIPEKEEEIPEEQEKIPELKPLKQSKAKQIKTKQNSPRASKPAIPAVAGRLKVDDKIPFWDKLVKTWFDFHEEKKLEKPSFKGPDPRHLKIICGQLKHRVEGKGNVWDETKSVEALHRFLELAYDPKNFDNDPWLQQNFLLQNLDRQFDKILNSVHLATRPAIVKIKFPNYWSVTEERKLQPDQLPQYWDYLKSIGWQTYKNSRNETEWRKIS